MIKINNIKEIEGRKDIRKVELNNDVNFDVSEESLFKYGLHIGAEYSDDSFTNILFSIKVDEAYSKALVYVYRRLRTSYEVQFMLKGNGYTDQCIRKVIDKLTESGYIDDENYADKYVKSNIKLSKKSKNFIFHELIHKGIDKEVVENVLLKYDFNDNQRALELLKKKYSSAFMGKDAEYKDIVKMKRFLYNKGFDNDNVNYAIENMIGKAYNEDCF